MADDQQSPIIRRTTKLKKSKNGKREEESGDDGEVIPCTQQPERKKRLFCKTKKETSSSDIQLSPHIPSSPHPFFKKFPNIYDDNFFGDYPDLACYKDDSNISKNNTDNKKQEVGKKTDRIGSGALASLRGFKQWKRENREKYEELMKKQKKEEEEEEESSP